MPVNLGVPQLHNWPGRGISPYYGLEALQGSSSNLKHSALLETTGQHSALQLYCVQKHVLLFAGLVGILEGQDWLHSSTTNVFFM